MVVGIALAAALAVGAFDFSHALEPGRSEAQGIVLNTLVDRNAGATPNDWYSAVPNAPVIRRHDALALTAPATGRMTISRVLPVFAHQCYELVYRLDVRSGKAAIAVYDQDVTRFLDYAVVTPTHHAQMRLRFSSGDMRRITLAVAGQAGTRASLGSMRLIRLGSHTKCGNDRPGNDIGLPFSAQR
jgi:hypothetical protein